MQKLGINEKQMESLKHPEQKEEEKLTWTPPSKAEEDAFHAKLHKEMEEAKKAKAQQPKIFSEDDNDSFDMLDRLMNNRIDPMEELLRDMAGPPLVRIRNMQPMIHMESV